MISSFLFAVYKRRLHVTQKTVNLGSPNVFNYFFVLIYQVILVNRKNTVKYQNYLGCSHSKIAQFGTVCSKKTFI